MDIILKRSESLNEYLKQNPSTPPKYPAINNLPQEFTPIYSEQIPAPPLDIQTTISSRDVDFDLRATTHLLRRTTFGPTWEPVFVRNMSV